MLKIAHRPADHAPTVEPTTVGAILRTAAQRAPDQPAVVESRADSGLRHWTYRELLDAAERTARALLARFHPGDHIAVWSPNSVEWLFLEYGLALAGMTLVPVNPAFRAAELRYVLAESHAAGLFLRSDYRGNPMRATAEGLRAELPDLREIIGFEEWEDFVARGAPTPFPTVGPESIAQIQFTSGTTGDPKGTMLTHAGITNNARFAFSRLDFPPGSSALHALPFFHTGGSIMLALGPMQNLWTHVLIDGFDPARMLELIETERVDVLLGVPTMFAAMLEHPDYAKRDLSSLQAVVAGGASITPTLVERMEERFGAGYVAMYGQTEASGVVTTTSLDDSSEIKAFTVGRPLPNTEVRIVEPGTTDVVDLDVAGELLVRGYGVMAGYFEMEAETAATLEPDGWLHTGDLCTMDAAGNLRVVGRTKEMIIRGGENIFPPEIERVLATHPAVAEVSVVGVPDERWGEQVAAFVRPAAGASVDTEELTAFTRERLASAKCPRIWRFVDEFPLTASGKIQKFKLRELWETT